MSNLLSWLSWILSLLHRSSSSSSSRDPNRDFSLAVKQEERLAANFACRICGRKDNLECAHIYSVSRSSAWKRTGSIYNREIDDNFVSSVENCVLLCSDHHQRIDSKIGIEKCTVDYLMSLRNSLTQCTALIDGSSGEWRRCKNRNTRIKDGNYRCPRHPSGGLESTIPKRTRF